jgi:hypothetical protein
MKAHKKLLVSILLATLVTSNLSAAQTTSSAQKQLISWSQALVSRLGAFKTKTQSTLHELATRKKLRKAFAVAQKSMALLGVATFAITACYLLSPRKKTDEVDQSKNPQTNEPKSNIRRSASALDLQNLVKQYRQYPGFERYVEQMYNPELAALKERETACAQDKATLEEGLADITTEIRNLRIERQRLDKRLLGVIGAQVKSWKRRPSLLAEGASTPENPILADDIYLPPRQQ